MSQINITESMIRAAATPESFQRGKSYFEQGAILNAAIQGNIVSGDCEGTQSPFYHVRVEFDAAGIRSADCTCPYDFGGYCKHIVALLLTYVHTPKEFATRASPAELLADLARDDLIALMTQLIEHQPDLYDWVHAAIAVPPADQSKRASHKKVDTEVYRRQVRNILHCLDGMRMSEAYRHVGGLANELRGVKDNAMKFLEQGDAETALAILLTLLDEAHDAFDYIDDSDGELGACLDEMGLPLAETILSLEMSAVERARLVQQLQELDRHLSNYGVEGVASIALQAAMYGWNDRGHLGDAPPSSRTTPSNAEEEWTEGDDEDEEYTENLDYHSLHSSLADLTEAKLNVLDRQGKTDEYLALCHKEDKPLRYVLKLCELDRVEEAVRFAHNHLKTASEALQVAQEFRELERVEEAIAIAERGLTLAPPRATLGAWLGPIEESRGRTHEAFDAFLAAFAELPSLETYKTLKRLAEPTWDKTRAQVMGALKKSYSHQVLAQVHLFEEEWDEAIKVAEQRETWYAVTAMVADGVLEQRPEWVIQVSLKQAERLIAKTQSKYYHAAAEWLERAKKAYARLERSRDWRTYLEQLKENYKRRPALQAELNRL